MLTLFLVDKLKLISEPEFIFLKISYRIFAEVVVLPSVVIFTSSIMSSKIISKSVATIFSFPSLTCKRTLERIGSVFFFLQHPERK